MDNLAGPGSFGRAGRDGVCPPGVGAGILLHGQCDELPALPPGWSLRAASPGDPRLAGVDITLNFFINKCLWYKVKT